MKNNIMIRRTIGICVILMGMAGWAKGTTYYLRTAASASLPGSWYTTLTGGIPAQDFKTGGDLFIISAGTTGTFNSSLEIGSTSANSGVNFQINGTAIIKSGVILTLNAKINKTTPSSMLVKGTIEFESNASVILNCNDANQNFTLASGAILKTANSNGISGSITKGTGITNPLISLDTNANFEFNGGNQPTTGLPATVNNLTLSGSGTKTLAAATTVTGDLTINSQATLTTNNLALTLQGNFISSGTFNAGSSTITISGDKTQSIAGFTTTGPVTVNKSANAATLTGSSTFTGLTITAGNLTIPAGGQVTVSGNLTNNAGASGLSLLSDATGTGSLIVNGTATTAQATVKRYMTSGAWHLVSAPVTGQSIGSFLSGNTAIPTPVGATDPRAMRAYDAGGNQWGEFFSSTNTNQIIAGTGYCMRVKASATNHEVVFTGALQSGDIPVNGLSAGNWNCIGNPYTSAIGITNDASSTDNFLKFNAVTNANIDPTSGIYIWDNPDEVNGQPGKYTTISNASNLKGLHYLQQGQGFMVKMAAGKTSVSFTKAMQVPDPSLSLKSTENIWPTINLTASADSVNSSTIIAFHEGMTNGLDVTYDAGLLRSGGPLELYTRLIDDYGIPFAIQALASDPYDQLIIPVGVDYSKGGKVSFSAQSFYLPSSCRPILEDRLTGLFTDLTEKTYTADLTSNTAGTGRFFLHTSYATTGTDSRKVAQKLSAWALNRQEININGKVNNGAVASLYDIQGRLIATHAMREGIRHRFSLPFLQPGLYLLKVRDGQQQQALKVVIGQ